MASPVSVKREEAVPTLSLVPPDEREPETTLVSDQKDMQKAISLVEAKDRSQLAATTAMSIVDVALLKELLDNGPEGKYYTLVLCLISMALILQIIIGVLAMMVSHMRSYYDKHGEVLCSDVFHNVCCLKCKRSDRTQTWQENDGVRCCCLPCSVTTHVRPHHEYVVIHRYRKWNSNAIDAELRAAETKAVLQSISEATKDADNTADAEYKAAKAEDIAAQTQLRISNDRGEILSKKMEKMRRDNVLKQIAFWQHVINYLLYCVFILSAFIAGMGIFTRGPDSAPMNAAADQGFVQEDVSGWSQNVNMSNNTGF